MRHLFIGLLIALALISYSANMRWLALTAVGALILLVYRIPLDAPPVDNSSADTGNNADANND